MWEGQFTDNYNSGNTNWTRTYANIWSRQYAAIWNVQYSDIYNKNYEGGPYAGTRSYAGVYQGDYSRAYVPAWTRTYATLYTGPRWYAFVGRNIGTFIGVYSGQFTKQYEGSFTGQYEGTFNKQFLKSYVKTYGGAYLGARAYSNSLIIYTTSYTGTTLYTKSTVANTTTQVAYAKTTSILSQKTGELTHEAIARVKVSDDWVQAQDIHIKRDNSWAQLKAAYIKKDGVWQLTHLGWERTDIDISSVTANFVLQTHLLSLGNSPSTRPQLVNIYVNPTATVYSGSLSLPAFDFSTLSSINVGGNSIKHQVRLVVLGGAKVIGSSGAPGSRTLSTRTGGNGGNGGNAILTGNGVELYIENYGLIAGGGGGGGTGGYPVRGSVLNAAGGLGGRGAGYNGTLFIADDSSDLTAESSSVVLGVDGGNGGALGHRGNAAGGHTDEAGNVVANDGTFKTFYNLSGNGGYPGSAIKGYDATRVTFINTGNIYGDLKYKFIS